MTKTEKTYLALKEINRPAHYSEVFQMYMTLFPEDECTEHNVHAILGEKELGIVWIGLKGTYALSEWGYERPNKTLFEAVCEIVQKAYDETGKPVSFNVILAEIGKYRRSVKFASLVVAAQWNTKLKRVSKDNYIPNSTSSAETDDNFISDDFTNELDKKIKSFEYQ